MNQRTYVLLFALLLSCAILSCGRDEKMDRVNEYLAEVIPPKDLSRLKTVIIIPREGCGGCIKSATAYSIAHYSEENAYVFTLVQDKKLFRQQIGREFLSKNNVYVDSLNHYQKGDLYDPYPKICKLENGKAVSFTNFEPEASVKK